MKDMPAPGPDIPEIELKLNVPPPSITFDRENEVISRLFSHIGVSSMRDRQAPIISMKNTLSQNEQRWPADGIYDGIIIGLS